jgi:hypothetical protein
MKSIAAIACVIAVFAAAPASAQSAMGDSAKELLGTWEFSNADRDKICSITFKADTTKVGFKVEFDKNCVERFAMVKDVSGWTFPENDLLRLLDAQGKAVVEFSEVEDGIYEAPTPGVGVLFLQKADAAGPAPKPPDQLAGNWAIMRGPDKTVCNLTLANTPLRDDLALTVKPGCDPAIVRIGFSQWRVDRGELVLVSTRGISWRFEEIEGGNWRRIPETAEPTILVRQ